MCMNSMQILQPLFQGSNMQKNQLSVHSKVCTNRKDQLKSRPDPAD